MHIYCVVLVSTSQSYYCVQSRYPIYSYTSIILIPHVPQLRQKVSFMTPYTPVTRWSLWPNIHLSYPSCINAYIKKSGISYQEYIVLPIWWYILLMQYAIGSALCQYSVCTYIYINKYTILFIYIYLLCFYMLLHYCSSCYTS